MRYMSIAAVSFLVCCSLGCSTVSLAEAVSQNTFEGRASPNFSEDLPNVTESGYLPLAQGTKDALFYAYYTAQNTLGSSIEAAGAPLLVWLQVAVPSGLTLPAHGGHVM